MIQTKTLLACLAAATFALSSSALAEDAAAPAATENHPRSVKAMRFDTNNDGNISAEEFTARAKTDAQKQKQLKGFKQFDADSDGLVTLSELDARFNSMKKKK
jgi:Ca2+-binding EF-hand superfamily protein